MSWLRPLHGQPDHYSSSLSDQVALFAQIMGGRLRGFKRSMYEGGLRTAAFAWWPGTVPAGRVSDEPWLFWDYLPTVAELIGAELPDGFHPDGRSLVSFLKGGPAPPRDYFYWELREGNRSIQAVRFGIGDRQAGLVTPRSPPTASGN